nr:MAG: protease/methyltransferase/helicase [Grapevine leafroll-associated virus 7]
MALLCSCFYLPSGSSTIKIKRSITYLTKQLKHRFGITLRRTSDSYIRHSLLRVPEHKKFYVSRLIKLIISMKEELKSRLSVKTSVVTGRDKVLCLINQNKTKTIVKYRVKLLRSFFNLPRCSFKSIPKEIKRKYKNFTLGMFDLIFNNMYDHDLGGSRTVNPSSKSKSDIIHLNNEGKNFAVNFSFSDISSQGSLTLTIIVSPTEKHRYNFNIKRYISRCGNYCHFRASLNNSNVKEVQEIFLRPIDLFHPANGLSLCLTTAVMQMFNENRGLGRVIGIFPSRKFLNMYSTVNRFCVDYIKRMANFGKERTPIQTSNPKGNRTNSSTTIRGYVKKSVLNDFNHSKLESGGVFIPKKEIHYLKALVKSGEVVRGGEKVVDKQKSVPKTTPLPSSTILFGTITSDAVKHSVQSEVGKTGRTTEIKEDRVILSRRYLDPKIFVQKMVVKGVVEKYLITKPDGSKTEIINNKDAVRNLFNATFNGQRYFVDEDALTPSGKKFSSVKNGYCWLDAFNFSKKAIPEWLVPLPFIPLYLIFRCGVPKTILRMIRRTGNGVCHFDRRYSHAHSMAKMTDLLGATNTLSPLGMGTNEYEVGLDCLVERVMKKLTPRGDLDTVTQLFNAAANRFDDWYKRGDDVVVKTYVTGADKKIISDLFPDLKIKYEGTTNSSHPLFTVIRQLENYLMFRINNFKNFSDFGGNILTHISMGVKNSHVCAPLCDVKDVNRRVKLYCNISKEIHSMSDNAMCTNKAQDCSHNSKTAVMVEVYDMSIYEVARSMLKREIIKVDASMLLPGELLEDFDVVDLFDKRCIITKVGEKVQYRYGVNGEVYEHDLKPLKEWMSVGFFSVDGVLFKKTLENSRGPFQHYSIVVVEDVQAKTLVVETQYQTNSNNMVEIVIPTINSDGIVSKEKLRVDKSFLTHLLEYASNCVETFNRKSFEHLMSQYRSRKGFVVYNNKVIQESVHIPHRLLDGFLAVVWAHGMRMAERSRYLAKMVYDSYYTPSIFQLLKRAFEIKFKRFKLCVYENILQLLRYILGGWVCDDMGTIEGRIVELNRVITVRHTLHVTCKNQPTSEFQEIFNSYVEESNDFIEKLSERLKTTTSNDDVLESGGGSVYWKTYKRILEQVSKFKSYFKDVIFLTNVIFDVYISSKMNLHYQVVRQWVSTLPCRMFEEWKSIISQFTLTGCANKVLKFILNLKLNFNAIWNGFLLSINKISLKVKNLLNGESFTRFLGKDNLMLSIDNVLEQYTLIQSAIDTLRSNGVSDEVIENSDYNQIMVLYTHFMHEKYETKNQEAVEDFSEFEDVLLSGGGSRLSLPQIGCKLEEKIKEYICLFHRLSKATKNAKYTKLILKVVYKLFCCVLKAFGFRIQDVFETFLSIHNDLVTFFDENNVCIDIGLHKVNKQIKNGCGYFTTLCNKVREKIDGFPTPCSPNLQTRLVEFKERLAEQLFYFGNWMTKQDGDESDDDFFDCLESGGGSSHMYINFLRRVRRFLSTIFKTFSIYEKFVFFELGSVKYLFKLFQNLFDENFARLKNWFFNRLHSVKENGSEIVYQGEKFLFDCYHHFQGLDLFRFTVNVATQFPFHFLNCVLSAGNPLSILFRWFGSIVISFYGQLQVVKDDILVSWIGCLLLTPVTLSAMSPMTLLSTLMVLKTVLLAKSMKSQRLRDSVVDYYASLNIDLIHSVMNNDYASTVALVVVLPLSLFMGSSLFFSIINAVVVYKYYHYHHHCVLVSNVSIASKIDFQDLEIDGKLKRACIEINKKKFKNDNIRTTRDVIENEPDTHEVRGKQLHFDGAVDSGSPSEADSSNDSDGEERGCSEDNLQKYNYVREKLQMERSDRMESGENSSEKNPSLCLMYNNYPSSSYITFKQTKNDLINSINEMYFIENQTALLNIGKMEHIINKYNLGYTDEKKLCSIVNDSNVYMWTKFRGWISLGNNSSTEEIDPKFIFLKNKKIVDKIPDDCDVAFTTNELVVGYSNEKLKNIEKDGIFGTQLPIADDKVLISKVDAIVKSASLVNKPPGSGKTTEIIRKATTLAKMRNDVLILSVTRGGKDEILDKLSQSDFVNGSITVRTVDSFIINNVNKKFDCVFVDECFMAHGGLVLYALCKLNCDNITLYGDINQIPYICRLPHFHCRFSETLYRLVTTTFDNVSYRCPADVCYLLSSERDGRGNLIYPNGVKAMKNERIRTMNLVPIKGINSIPVDVSKDVAYITFTQHEKHELNRYLNTNTVKTVNEIQGHTVKNVNLVRMRVHANEIYSDRNQFITAISRHTETFNYYYASNATKDKVMNAVGSLNTIEDYVLANFCFKQCV